MGGVGKSLFRKKILSTYKYNTFDISKKKIPLKLIIEYDYYRRKTNCDIKKIVKFAANMSVEEINIIGREKSNKVKDSYQRFLLEGSSIGRSLWIPSVNHFKDKNDCLRLISDKEKDKFLFINIDQCYATTLKQVLKKNIFNDQPFSGSIILYIGLHYNQYENFINCNIGYKKNLEPENQAIIAISTINEFLERNNCLN